MVPECKRFKNKIEGGLSKEQRSQFAEVPAGQI